MAVCQTDCYRGLALLVRPYSSSFKPSINFRLCLELLHDHDKNYRRRL